MEQHYIVIYGMNEESIGCQYNACIIVKEYPGDPGKLFKLLVQTIENNSISNFGRFQKKEMIAVKSITRTL